MKTTFRFRKPKRDTIIFSIVFLLLTTLQFNAEAQTLLRRPISPDQPMWIVHIDTWNHADPQKIIDLIPKDIRPYAVMNISLSTFHDDDGRFQRAEYGYEIVKSWVRTCAENQMWVLIQPSSGGLSHFSDTDLSVYEEFFRDYPNVIGFNYAEQFWGYDDPDSPHSAAWTDRMSHFANLLELSNQYGGYLVVSWCGNKWVPGINPVAMMKRNPSFAAACRDYTENYILCEKYTQQSYISDMESVCLGAYLSGYSGQYGIRYDNTGWTDANGDNANFILATGGAAHLEHVMLTGQTVIDGPEIIWQNCFRETNRIGTSDGYTMRNWETFPQFDNVSVDMFRKILDGTVRIPTRQEVIDRTKLVIINDVNSGGDDGKYSSPERLFEGLYRMDGDGNYGDNHSFYKKTGRYPAIPTVFELDDTPANSFQVKVDKSSYSSRWPGVSSKVSEFNNLFPEEYTGTIYAGRHENAWVIYNPFKTVTTATGNIPFKYNTCSSMDLSLSRYTSGVVKEYSDRLDIYLNNYDNVLNTGLKTDEIKIHGSSSEPTYTYTDRGSHQASNVTSSWSGGVFTLTVEHNGAVDITINCSGTASDRLTSYTTANVTAPRAPPVYTGARQYEAESFDYKDISGIVTNGYSGDIRNYSGQGYLGFGTNSSASVRDYVTVPHAGTFPLDIRYSVTGSSVNTIDLYVNGAKVTTPDFTSTPSTSDWAVNTQDVSLNAGTNRIELVATSAAPASVYFDHFTVGGGSTNSVWIEAECGTIGSLWDSNLDDDASNGGYVTIQSGNNNADDAPTDADSQISYSFGVSESGNYTIWARVIAPSINDDSFWISVDGGSWLNWDNIASSTTWTWDDISEYTLVPGPHTITVAYREDGAKLDKLYITSEGSTPSGEGSAASNCTVSNQAPVADAGSDQTVTDSDNNGRESITLDGTSSNDPDGSITFYAWSEGGSQIATGADPSVDLPVGTHQITLMVTDDQGATDRDDITVTVNSGLTGNTAMWLEAECGTVGSLWNVVSDENASNGEYVTIKADNNSTDGAPTDANGQLSYSFEVTEGGTYIMWARVIAPSANDDSFWIRLDGGSWLNWNNIVSSTAWTWDDVDYYTLDAGSHTLTIAYREDGAQLDKLYIANTGEFPSGEGSIDNNCNSQVTSVSKQQNERGLQFYPNPVEKLLNIRLESDQESGVASIYSLSGQFIRNVDLTSIDNKVDVSDLPQGIYFLEVTTPRSMSRFKFIKK